MQIIAFNKLREIAPLSVRSDIETFFDSMSEKPENNVFFLTTGHHLDVHRKCLSKDVDIRENKDLTGNMILFFLDLEPGVQNINLSIKDKRTVEIYSEKWLAQKRFSHNTQTRRVLFGITTNQGNEQVALMHNVLSETLYLELDYSLDRYWRARAHSY